MPVFADRVLVTTATTGTGSLTLGTPVAGYQSFADGGVTDGDTVTYVLRQGDDVEIGTGTYTAAGAVLSRDTVHRSIIAGVAGTAALNLTGPASVLVTARGADLATAAQGALAEAALSRAGGTMTGLLTLLAYTETVETLPASVNITLGVAAGTVKKHTMVGNTTYTLSLASGQTVVLFLDDGTGFVPTFNTVDEWHTADGNPPALKATGLNALIFSNVAGTVVGWGSGL